MNKRRQLLSAIGAGALTVSVASFGQQPSKVWRVGYLSQRVRPDSFDTGLPGSFRRGMRELGYVEGKNLMIEWRYAEGKPERLRSLVEELLQSKVDVILAGGTLPASVAQKATTVVPIVMGSSGDPVGSGLVKSLARPGGNVTGLTNISADISPKHLELLISIVPKLSRVGILVNPNNPAHTATLKNVDAAAKKAGIKTVHAEARNPQEIEPAFSKISRAKVDAVVVHNESLFDQQARQIAAIAEKNRLPAIYGRRQFTEAGGLLSYGPSFDDMFRRAATYVDKIFKGAKPADLPVEQPTKFELVINRKAANSLGLKIPDSVFLRADEVIE